MKKYQKINYGIVVFLYIVCGVFLQQTLILKSLEARIMPYVIIAITALVATFLLIRTIHDKKSDEYVTTGLDKVAIMAGLLLVYFVLVEYIGFYLASPIYLAVAMMALGQKSKKVLLLVSVITTLTIYVSFNVLLEMYMPTGKLVELLIK
jgi:hypothetical protein